MFHKLNVVEHDQVNNNPIRQSRKTFDLISLLKLTKAINAEIVSLDLRWVLLQTGKQELNNLWDKLSG
jgi:hypothetical protein